LSDSLFTEVVIGLAARNMLVRNTLRLVIHNPICKNPNFPSSAETHVLLEILVCRSLVQKFIVWHGLSGRPELDHEQLPRARLDELRFRSSDLGNSVIGLVWEP
jgi:hypothetical protein